MTSETQRSEAAEALRSLYGVIDASVTVESGRPVIHLYLNDDISGERLGPRVAEIIRRYLGVGPADVDLRFSIGRNVERRPSAPTGQRQTLRDGFPSHEVVLLVSVGFSILVGLYVSVPQAALSWRPQTRLPTVSSGVAVAFPLLALVAFLVAAIAVGAIVALAGKASKTPPREEGPHDVTRWKFFIRDAMQLSKDVLKPEHYPG